MFYIPFGTLGFKFCFQASCILVVKSLRTESIAVDKSVNLSRFYEAKTTFVFGRPVDLLLLDSR